VDVLEGRKNMISTGTAIEELLRGRELMSMK
jgi:hypothetical protein